MKILLALGCCMLYQSYLCSQDTLVFAVSRTIINGKRHIFFPAKIVKVIPTETFSSVVLDTNSGDELKFYIQRIKIVENKKISYGYNFDVEDLKKSTTFRPRPLLPKYLPGSETSGNIRWDKREIDYRFYIKEKKEIQDSLPVDPLLAYTGIDLPGKTDPDPPRKGKFTLALKNVWYYENGQTIKPPAWQKTIIVTLDQNSDTLWSEHIDSGYVGISFKLSKAKCNGTGCFILRIYLVHRSDGGLTVPLTEYTIFSLTRIIDNLYDLRDPLRLTRIIINRYY